MTPSSKTQEQINLIAVVLDLIDALKKDLRREGRRKDKGAKP